MYSLSLTPNHPACLPATTTGYSPGLPVKNAACTSVPFSARAWPVTRSSATRCSTPSPTPGVSCARARVTLWWENGHAYEVGVETIIGDSDWPGPAIGDAHQRRQTSAHAIAIAGNPIVERPGGILRYRDASTLV